MILRKHSAGFPKREPAFRSSHALPVSCLLDVLAAEYRGGLLSDNQWGIVLRRADGILVRDYDITGSSEQFKDHTVARSRQLCGDSSWTHQGIHMMSAVWNKGHQETGRGLRLRNILLSGYDKEQEWYPMCKSTEVRALHANTSHMLTFS